jgi:ArsR family transcriptional regulator, lead/cadmium/zinc/bismuth-responsive transcriptional repressor
MEASLPCVDPAREAGKQELAMRPLMDATTARGLARLFKLVGNETRLRLLHVLHRETEVCVGDLADRVGMAPQAVSNQLQRLVDRGIVSARRDGVRFFYHIADPCVIGLIDLGWCLIEETTVTPSRSGRSGDSP